MREDAGQDKANMLLMGKERGFFPLQCKQFELNVQGQGFIFFFFSLFEGH